MEKIPEPVVLRSVYRTSDKITVLRPDRSLDEVTSELPGIESIETDY